LRVAQVLAHDGVLARFGVDFMTVQRNGTWETTAIEINLRKGGTTHPFLMLQFLTDGEYDTATGTYYALNGNPCFYHATDNLQQPSFVGLTPENLIDIAVNNDLHFDAATQEGVMFHLIGALEEHGKVGALCVGRSRAVAEEYFEKTVAVLERESRIARPAGAAAQPVVPRGD
jgi:hypothetical protein